MGIRYCIGGAPAASFNWTDTVGLFTRANSEQLSITNAAQVGLAITGNLTFSCWVKMAQTTDTQGFMAQYDFAGASRQTRLFFSSGGAECQWIISNNGIATSIARAPTPTIGVWTLYTGVSDGTNIRLYKNATSGSPVAHTTGVYAGTSAFRMGYDEVGYLDGQMDMAGVWARALSGADVTALYNSGVPRPFADLSGAEKASLVSFWHLNEASGTRFDAFGPNDLTDTNTVTRATGPIEYLATAHAEITRVGP